MSMIKYRYLFASLVLVAAISCSSDNPGDDPNKGGQGEENLPLQTSEP